MIMIADVIYKNDRYYVLNEYGKEISHEFQNPLGELMGFSSVFMVFRKYDSIILMMNAAKR